MQPPTLAAAVHANLAVVRQGRALLARLDAGQYATRLAVCYHASIGAHLRHIIEHYQAFLAGFDAAAIDYEHRPRNRAVEEDPAEASASLAAVERELSRFQTASPNRVVAVVAETAPGHATASTVLRELEFLLSHTIHHYALVATLARLQGLEPDPTFGVAPSTLKFQQEQTACAR
jgi:uncharacterized damage-inducible protein DinB